MRKNGWAILGKALTVNEPVRWRGEKFGESVPALFEELPAPVDAVQLDEIKSDLRSWISSDHAVRYRRRLWCKVAFSRQISKIAH